MLIPDQLHMSTEASQQSIATIIWLAKKVSVVLAAHYVRNDSPHPHSLTTFGLST